MSNAQMQSASLNPFEHLDAVTLSRLIREMCGYDLSAQEGEELDVQIEAVVPAVIELRDAGYLNLSPRTLATAATLEGLITLAEDQRLTAMSRARCQALRDQYIAKGVNRLLGRIDPGILTNAEFKAMLKSKLPRLPE